MAFDVAAITGLPPSVGQAIGLDIVADAQGNTYLAGEIDRNTPGVTSGSAGPIDLDPANVHADNRDLIDAEVAAIFFAKYDSDGNFLWAKQAEKTPGSQHSFGAGHRIAVAPSGGIYFVGNYDESFTFENFTAPPVVNTAFEDRFAGKLNADGSLAWIKTFDFGSLEYHTLGIAVDEPRGRLYLSGQTDGLGLVASLNVSNAANVSVAWTRSLPNSTASDVAVDASGNVISVGQFRGTVDFDPGKSKFNVSAGASYGTFIWKLTTAGSFVWAKAFATGTGGSTLNSSVEVDASSNIYVAGGFRGAVDFQPSTGTLYLPNAGDSDVFLAKLSSAGNLVYARSYGTAGSDAVLDLALDSLGNVYATGWRTASAVEGFVIKYDANGTLQSQAVVTGTMRCNAITVNPVTNQIHVLGWYRGPLDVDLTISTELDSDDTTYDMFWMVLGQ